MQVLGSRSVAYILGMPGDQDHLGRNSDLSEQFSTFLGNVDFQARRPDEYMLQRTCSIHVRSVPRDAHRVCAWLSSVFPSYNRISD